MREHSTDEKWKVLVVGNNPIELGHLFERLAGITERIVQTETAFDLKTITERLAFFRPQHIIIDDNIGRRELLSMVNTLHQRKTRHIPITILKNSNYQETIGAGVMNFVLKQNLTSALLYSELLNSIRFLKSQQYWGKVFRKRGSQLARIFSAIQI
jgi:CheY-like chemotaxis protein